MEQSTFGIKASIQKLGRYLSSMIMPNIGAFIAWGIFAALFIPVGYLPNESLNKVVGMMQTYLLPLLIAYSGGAMVNKHRGGVVSTIATMGVIGGALGTPMFIGAMLMGPFAAWVIKRFDLLVEDQIPSGFEMLINNFSAGIIGFFLAIIGFFGVGPIVNWGTHGMEIGVNTIVSLGVLPLANVFIEPAKVLFLNNAINHGILTPLGTAQVAQTGRSILFLLEANPGPGLGILLAFALFGKGSAKSSSWGAMIIHFLGGIHEIYFPYVMTKPLLILAAIAGGVTGTFVNSLLGVGLTGPASPGSILAIFGVTAKGYHLQMLIAVLASIAVAFVVASIILKADKSEEDHFEQQQVAVRQAKERAKGHQTEKIKQEIKGNQIERIIFACDAGMGSSAMGASLLKKKVKSLGLPYSVTNSAINRLKNDSKTLVITQNELTLRAQQVAPDSVHISVDNFLDDARYDEILSEMFGQEEKNSEQVFLESTKKIVYDHVDHIIFVYTGETVGETTMGASLLRNQLKKINQHMTVVVDSLEEVKDSKNCLIIVQSEQYEQVKARLKEAQIISFKHLLNEANYTYIVEAISHL